jgi:arginase
MMNIRLLQVPYDSGHRARRMGCGPAHLVANGLPERLTALSVQVETELIEADGPFTAENQTTFELFRQVAGRVSLADHQGVFPIVLSGNCDMSLGSLAGLSPGRIGIIWFDAHSDFRTPERSYDGFLDGMGLAMIAGLCWRWATATVPGFRPLPPERLLHVGGRLLKEEVAWLNEAGVGYLPAGEMQHKGVERALPRCLDELRRHVERIDLHLDLDVLDPTIAPANDYARENGLTPEQVARAFELIADRFEIAALDVAAYDPARDPDGKLLQVALDLISQVVTLRATRP